MKSILTLAALIPALMASCLAAEQITPPPPADEVKSMEGAYSDTTVSGFHLEWMVDSSQILHIKLSARTTGWIAIGFKPTSMKKDANLILGYVKDDSVFVEDNFGVSAVLHEADTSLGGTNDVRGVEGSEENGATSIAFSIPLDSGDKYDQKLTLGERVKVILACAPNGADDFISIHRSVASLTIDIK